MNETRLAFRADPGIPTGCQPQSGWEREGRLRHEPIIQPNFSENDMKMKKTEPTGEMRPKFVYVDPSLAFAT